MLASSSLGITFTCQTVLNKNMNKLCFAKDAGKVSKDECKMGSLPNYQCPKTKKQTNHCSVCVYICIFSSNFQVASDFLMIVWLDKMQDRNREVLRYKFQHISQKCRVYKMFECENPFSSASYPTNRNPNFISKGVSVQDVTYICLSFLK